MDDRQLFDLGRARREAQNHQHARPGQARANRPRMEDLQDCPICLSPMNDHLHDARNLATRYRMPGCHHQCCFMCLSRMLERVNDLNVHCHICRAQNRIPPGMVYGPIRVLRQAFQEVVELRAQAALVEPVLPRPQVAVNIPLNNNNNNNNINNYGAVNNANNAIHNHRVGVVLPPGLQPLPGNRAAPVVRIRIGESDTEEESSDGSTITAASSHAASHNTDPADGPANLFIRRPIIIIDPNPIYGPELPPGWPFPPDGDPPGGPPHQNPGGGRNMVPPGGGNPPAGANPNPNGGGGANNGGNVPFVYQLVRVKVFFRPTRHVRSFLFELILFALISSAATYFGFSRIGAVDAMIATYAVLGTLGLCIVVYWLRREGMPSGEWGTFSSTGIWSLPGVYSGFHTPNDQLAGEGYKAFREVDICANVWREVMVKRSGAAVHDRLMAFIAQDILTAHPDIDSELLMHTAAYCIQHIIAMRQFESQCSRSRGTFTMEHARF